MQRLTILAIVSCASVGQTAEKPVAELEVPFIERPMTLPQRVARPTLDGDLSQNSGPSGGAGGSMAAAIDVGITARFQAGVLIAFPIAPSAGFGDLIFNAQGNLWHDKLNLRVDLGWQRQASSSAHVDTFFAEIGLPWRARFNRYV
jgi:hypothetical protein